MPKLYIPEIGDEIVLEQPWSFTLYNPQYESRNNDLLEALCEKTAELKHYSGASFDPIRYTYPEENTVTLPEGTKLKVDRIYIRKGASDYSSLSFFVTDTSHPKLQPSKTVGRGFKKGRKRFWAKLSDVNEIEMQQVAPK